jgi:hypothetical protein
MLDLNLLLEEADLDPNSILVMRHRPKEAPLRKIFGWFAEDEPDTFNTYQRSHGPKTEAALLRAKHLASFIGHEADRAVFVGIYDVVGSEQITRAECNLRQDYRRLIDLGMDPWDESDPRQDALFFDIRATNHMGDWKGRLVVDWPPPERSWYRWADRRRNIFPVRAIHEDSLLASAMPAWQELSLTWAELKALPRQWQIALSHWRGVYFIFDAGDGKGYVGSASGAENLLRRWLNYSVSGHGGNRLFRDRNPVNFIFSILQRVSPDTPADEVIAIENSWKARLHTRAPCGLNAN